MSNIEEGMKKAHRRTHTVEQLKNGLGFVLGSNYFYYNSTITRNEG